MRQKDRRSNGDRPQNCRKKSVKPLVLIAVLLTIVALALIFVPDIVSYYRAKHTQSTLQELYRGADAASLLDWLWPAAHAEELEQQEAVVDEKIEYIVHPDFEALYETNEHIVGWLTAGRDIDYPVVQYDNAFYLDHDYFGNVDKNGTIFLNAANKLSPRDSILLIHGHNMRSGAMFGNLDDFREYSYLQQYPIVSFRLISDAEDVYYVPIAAFDASMNPEAQGYFDITRIRFDFDILSDDPSIAPRSSVLEAQVAAMRELSFWDVPLEADSTDAYIILVSCSYNHDDGRLMLVCRQLREGETPESIRELLAAEN